MPTLADTHDLDPNLTPMREDLAASWLKGHVTAAKFVEPVRQQVTTSIANLYRSPEAEQALETQLLYGEPVDVFDSKDGWSWVQSVRDGYVGYLRADATSLIKGDASATHRVANVGTFLYPGKDSKTALKGTVGAFVTPGSSYKTTPIMPLSYGSMVRVVKQKEEISVLASGELIPTAHLTAFDFYAEDPVAEAFRFLGVPYLWGGRSHLGVDCSSLIQLVLQACNVKCPRNAYMQEEMLGKPIKREEVHAGDLVFFRGHVGLMVDGNTMIHGSDRGLAVTIDDLDEYLRWRAKAGKKPATMFKRI